MDHLAIMRKSWGLLEKILDGRKTIESRWYLTKRKPWDNIKNGETIYFKNSGEPAKIKAEVSKVLQFSELTPKRVGEIIKKFGPEDGICIKDVSKFYNLFKDKKYCLLIFLKNPKENKTFRYKQERLRLNVRLDNRK